MSNPITLSNSLRVPQPTFIAPDAQSEAIKSTTGLTPLELMAEQIESERQLVKSGAPSSNYIKLLLAVYGKTAIGAPIYQVTETKDPIANMSKEELEQWRNNLITRVALSMKTKKEPEPELNPEQPPTEE